MRIFWFLLRICVLVGIFIITGIWSAHLVLARAMAHGKPEYEVRLASYMAGLFVAGSVATIAGVGMLLLGRQREPK